MAHLSLSPPLQATPSPAFAGSCCTCSTVAGNDGSNNLTGTANEAMEKIGNDLEGLLDSSPENDYSDAVINVDGILVPVHRCILAARSAFFKAVFLTESSPDESNERNNQFDLNRFVSCGKIGYKPLMLVLRYFYGGKLKGVEQACSVSCMDSVCSHLCCSPVIHAYLELLCASSVFDILELKIITQQHLVNIFERVEIEDVLQIAVAACTHGAMELQEMCIQALASSNIEAFTLEKLLPKELENEIFALRVKLGLREFAYNNTLQEKQCRRIYKALDSDDIELVQLLMTESRLTIDSTYALHYAAAFCDSKTTAELLDLGGADINCRNKRGYTALHVAAMRRDPEIIGCLLEKAANALDLTPNGQTALQISKRMTRTSDASASMETREDHLRDKICVEILEQADQENPLSVFPVVGEKELFMRLLYLENRVALARLLFPQEAKVVLGLSQVDGTREFTGFKTRVKREANVDLNKEPSSGFFSDSESVNVPLCMDKTLIQRVEALQRAVEVGQRFFPRCIAILNKFMDDGSFEHACIQDRRVPEVHSKKRIHLTDNSELQDMFAEAFREDIAAMGKHKSGENELLVPSSSSSSSEEDMEKSCTLCG